MSQQADSVGELAASSQAKAHVMLMHWICYVRMRILQVGRAGETSAPQGIAMGLNGISVPRGSRDQLGAGDSVLPDAHHPHDVWADWAGAEGQGLL